MPTLAERVHTVFWFNPESEEYELIACFADEGAACTCSEQFQREKPNAKPMTLHHTWEQFCNFIVINRNSPKESP